MNKQEFEQFVMRDGKDILRFCRMNAGDPERGNELYQDTMLMLLEKRNQFYCGKTKRKNMQSATGFFR